MVRGKHLASGEPGDLPSIFGDACWSNSLPVEQPKPSIVRLPAVQVPAAESKYRSAVPVWCKSNPVDPCCEVGVVPVEVAEVLPSVQPCCSVHNLPDAGPGDWDRVGVVDELASDTGFRGSEMLRYLFVSPCGVRLTFHTCAVSEVLGICQMGIVPC